MPGVAVAGAVLHSDDEVNQRDPFTGKPNCKNVWSFLRRCRRCPTTLGQTRSKSPTQKIHGKDQSSVGGDSEPWGRFLLDSAVSIACYRQHPKGRRIRAYSKDLIGLPLKVRQIFPVSSRRLDIRIRELCARAVSADDQSFAPILSELRSALHEHAVKMREMAVRQIAPPRKTRLQRPEEEPCQSTLSPTSD